MSNETVKKAIIHCDGSALGNGNEGEVFGGYAAIIQYPNGKEKTIVGSELDTTNSRMEIKALTEALKHLKGSYELTFYSDSQYVVKGVNEWINGWIRKGFRGLKNKDLWKDYLEYSKNHIVRGVWVKGHSNNEMNNLVDELARSEAEKLKIKHLKAKVPIGVYYD